MRLRGHSQKTEKDTHDRPNLSANFLVSLLSLSLRNTHIVAENCPCGRACENAWHELARDKGERNERHGQFSAFDLSETKPQPRQIQTETKTQPRQNHNNRKQRKSLNWEERPFESLPTFRNNHNR